MSYRTVIFEQNYYWLLVDFFSFFEFCMHLIANFRCNDTVFESAVAMESFSIERIEVIVHKCSKKRCFRNTGGTYKKTPAAKYNFR